MIEVVQTTSLVPSRFSYKFDTGNIGFLFHTISQKLFAINLQDSCGSEHDSAHDYLSMLLSTNSYKVEPLKQGDFFVNGSCEDEELLKKAFQDAPPAEVDIWNLKLIVTNSCNLACDYCVIEGNLKHNSTKKMTIETATKALKMFSKHGAKNDHPKVIMLYGGEPLMNLPVVKHVISETRRMEQEGELAPKVDIVLETNGTLITEEIARLLYENNVLVQVSIDGPEDIHNKMRKFKSGRGSHREAVAGFEIARKMGCTCVVSAVFGSHVAEDTSRVIKYFTEELKPLTIGLDLLHLIEHCENPASVNVTELCSSYLNAWEQARDAGLYVEHVVRRLRPFIEGKIKWKDCPSCGNRMVVRSDGKVGVCEAFLASGDFFGDYLDSSPPMSDSSPFSKWAGRLAFMRDGCLNCPAASICGMGCGYNSHVSSGDFKEKDEKVCLTSVALLHWAFEQIANNPNVVERVKQHNITEIMETEKRAVLGEVPLRPDVVLTNISQFAEAGKLCE